MRAILFFVSLLTAACVSAAVVRVMDASTRSAVEGATVISDRGMILGITGADGSIDIASRSHYPLEIRSMGFEAAKVESPVDSVFLVPAVYELSEFTVIPGERPIAKITCFAREYTSGATPADTMQLYGEYMLVSYLAPEKTKGYKKGDLAEKKMNSRYAARFANAEGLDSIAVPKEGDDMTLLSFYNIITSVPGGEVEEPEAIRSGASADTVAGKYSPVKFMKKTPELYVVTSDFLGNFKDHRWSPLLFKIIGMTLDMNKVQKVTAFKPNDAGKYSVNDFIYSSGTMRATAKGKIFRWFLKNKTDLDIDCYAEVYPVSIEYLTTDEYKEDRKDRTAVPFQAPKNLLPLPAAVERLIERASEK